MSESNFQPDSREKKLLHHIQTISKRIAARTHKAAEQAGKPSKNFFQKVKKMMKMKDAIAALTKDRYQASSNLSKYKAIKQVTKSKKPT